VINHLRFTYYLEAFFDKNRLWITRPAAFKLSQTFARFCRPPGDIDKVGQRPRRRTGGIPSALSALGLQKIIHYADTGLFAVTATRQTPKK
jgi:hypothetical protein